MSEQPTKPQGTDLGQLYIDFTTKGLPGFLKDLNNVSSGLLLPAKLAENLTTQLNNLTLTTGDSATNINKMAASLGATAQEYQKLLAFIKSNNLSDNLISDFQKLEILFQDASRGFPHFSAEFLRALNFNGLNHANYKGDFESVVRFLTDVDKKASKMTPIARNTFYRDLGLSQEWSYTSGRGGFSLNDAFLIPDDEIEKLVQANEAVNELNNSIENLKSRGTSIYSPILKNSAKEINEMLKELDKGSTKAKAEAVGLAGATGIGLIGGAVTGAISGARIGSAIGGIGAVTGALIGAWVGGKGGATVGANTGRFSLGVGRTIKENIDKNKAKKVDKSTGFAASLSATPVNPDWFSIDIPKPINDYSSLPIPQEMQAGNGYIGALPNLSQTNHIEIRTENKIYGANPTETANKVTNLITEQMARSQYEAHNLAGL